MKRLIKLPQLVVALAMLGGFVPSFTSGQTNRELIDGAIEHFEAADKKMNAAYQKLLGILDADGKSSLRDAQRAWISWRDAQAEFDSHQFGDGKLRPLERWGSRAQSTEARTTRLLDDYKRFKET